MMKWFSRNKTKTTLPAIPAEQAIQQASTLIPEYFQNNSYYVAFTRNLAQQKLPEAFMNLLTMQDTSGYLFSVAFWDSMEQGAAAFGMKDVINICQQKRKETIDSGHQVPIGSALKMSPDGQLLLQPPRP